MLQISGDKVRRDGAIVGYIEGMYIKGHDYKPLGYFKDDQHIYDVTGKPVAYIDGEYLYAYTSRSSRTELDKINKAIKGDVLSEIARCAVYQLIGA